jgi:ADP-heptose:LPS heptosyltransferase
MNNGVMYPGFFRAASKITDIFPHAGSSFLDLTILPVAGSNLLATHKLRGARRIVEEVGRFDRLLVVSDLNIGDALFSQALVSGLRDFFPAAVIDLAINRTASGVVIGNPEITNVLPVFTGAPFPSKEDLASLSHITGSSNYNLVISNSPYFELKDFPSSAKNVLDYSPFAAVLVNAFKNDRETAHVIYQLQRIIHLLFEGIAEERRFQKYLGVRAMLPIEAIERARTFLRKNGIGESDRLVLINPDTSSRFTTIPLDVLSELLRKISTLGCPILLGSGYIDLGKEKRLLETLSDEEKKSVTVVAPMIGLEVYSALIDFSHVFITGDSGPLHIAAARKYLRDGYSALNNQTELISIFGATPARTYAYDSMIPGFFPANQDAPSHAHVSNSPCRNVTCVNKMGKTCRRTRCFEFVDVDAIVSDVEKALARELN